MQAVILAAGKSSRFYPYTGISHKSLFPIMGKPIITHTLLSIKTIGIRDVIIVISKDSAIKKLIGQGRDLGLKITYVVQKEKPQGMGYTLLLAKKHIKGNFFLLHPHHVDISRFAKDMISAKTKDTHEVLLAEKREDTWKYGVLKTVKDKVVDLVEKPEKGSEPSKLCIVGIYLFSKGFLSLLSKVPQEHYQFEKAIAQFAKKASVRVVQAKTPTVTLKYAWDIFGVKDYLFSKMKKYIAKNVSIAKDAKITGKVYIEEGVKIMEGAHIKGPCYIGKNAYIGTNALLRNGVDVEESSTIGAFMEIKNSIVLENSTTHSGFIGDSIIGKNCKIAAQFCSGNVRLDRKPVQVKALDEAIDSGRKYLGAIIGNSVMLGIKVSTMPGVIIGNGATIGPSTVVMHNVLDNTLYYTKFQEVVTVKK